MNHILKTSSCIMDRCNELMTLMDNVSDSISVKDISYSKVEYNLGLRTESI